MWKTVNELEEKRLELSENDVEIVDVGNLEYWLMDHADGKVSIHRFSSVWDKEQVIRNVIEMNHARIDWDRLIELLCQLDDCLFQNVHQIVFLDKDIDRDGLLEMYDNTDVIDYDKEVGKMIYMDDTVIINVSLIEKIAGELYGRGTLLFIEEVNLGIWTTLIHELRHVWQRSLAVSMYGDDFGDEEDDAETYGNETFEKYIQTKEYFVWDVK